MILSICKTQLISTPWKPTGVDNKTMPVMFFIHGGAFAFGTQIRMGGERLQVEIQGSVMTKSQDLLKDKITTTNLLKTENQCQTMSNHRQSCLKVQFVC